MKKLKLILIGAIGILSFCQIQLAVAGQFKFDMKEGFDTSKYAYSLVYQKNTPATGTVLLTNTDKENSITLQISVVDGKTNSQGNIYFTTVGSKQSYLGKWGKVENATITLQPQEVKTATFTIQPPDNATPGDYAGGLIIEDVTPSSTKESSGAASAFSAIVKVRYAEKIFFSIPGEKKANYQFDKFSYDRKTNSFNFKLTNTGNTLLSASGNISISDGIKEVKKIEIKGDSLLPNDEFNGNYNWNEHETWGKYTATLNLDVSATSPFDTSAQKLTGVNQTINIQFDNYEQIFKIVSYVLWLILLIILIILAFWLKKKLYLKKCIPYTVLQDETVMTIANKFSMKWKKLVKINKINAPYELKVGQVILVKKPKELNNVQK